MAVNADSLITGCPQKTGIGVALDIFTRPLLPDSMIPSIKRMAGRAREVADTDLFPIRIKYLDVTRLFIIKRHNVSN
jgi:hypothetical protein